jgi:MFS family permease
MGPVVRESAVEASAGIIATDIPARLDRLRWGRFHTLVVVALGITWILDGLEVTLAGAVSPALKESPQLRFSNADVGLVSSAYLAGAVMGALFFGWLTDRLGRKRLFFITLVVYLLATAATALSWNIWSFALFRFLTGAGIGGEYTSINSAIQELVAARHTPSRFLYSAGSFLTLGQEKFADMASTDKCLAESNNPAEWAKRLRGGHDANGKGMSTKC